MTAPLCTVDRCDRPSPGAYLCAGEGSCTEKLRRDLRDVVDGLLDDLEVSYLRQARFSGIRAIRNSDDAPLPWDERAASTTSTEIRNTVLRWARVVLAEDPDGEQIRTYLARAEHDIDVAYAASRVGQARTIRRQVNQARYITPARTVDAAALLLDRLAWLRQQPAAGVAFTELHKTIGRAVRAVDCPLASSFVGVCPGDWPEAEACGATLYGQAKAKQHRCAECGRLWNVDELRPYFVTRAREWLATATEISRALPALGELRATPERIRKWKQRGRLQVRGSIVRKNRDGVDVEQPTYRVGDVEDLLSQDAAIQARREAKREAV